MKPFKNDNTNMNYIRIIIIIRTGVWADGKLCEATTLTKNVDRNRREGGIKKTKIKKNTRFYRFLYVHFDKHQCVCVYFFFFVLIDVRLNE